MSESGMGKNTIIIDLKAKRTTTLIEAMGMKRGFYSTAEDESRAEKEDGFSHGTNASKNTIVSTMTSNTSVIHKKIAGYPGIKSLDHKHQGKWKSGHDASMVHSGNKNGKWFLLQYGWHGEILQ